MNENHCTIKFPNPAIPASLIAIGIILSGVFLGDSIKYFKNFDRYVEVKGLSERVVKADEANWQISVASSGNDLKSIYATINSQQQIITDFLTKEGFAVSDIQKQPISITDNQANAYNTNKSIVKYSATAGVTITTSNVDRVTQAVQDTNQLVASGVLLTNNNVSYSYQGLNNIKASMLNDALSNASVAGMQFAKQSDSALGKIRNASQGLFSITAADGSSSDSSINKKVRVVTTVQFFLK